MKKTSNIKGISFIDIIIIVSAVIILVVSGIFMMNNISRHIKAADEIEGLQTRINDNKANIARLTAMQDNEEFLLDQLETQNTYIPEGRDNLRIFNDINNIAGAAKATVKGISYEPTIDLEQDTVEVPILLKIETTYDNFIILTDYIRNYERMYIIKTVNIFQTGNDDILGVEMKLSTYYRN